MNEKTNDKKAFFKTICIVLAAFIIFKLIGVFVLRYVPDGIYRTFATEATISLCALGAAFASNRIGTLKLSTTGFGTGLFVGMFILISSIFRTCIFAIQYSKNVMTINVSTLEIILFVLAMVMVGFAEELLFRGVLLNGCLDFYGENSAFSINKAIVVSGIIFGAAHIFNVFIGASLTGSVMQVANGIAMGILFGAVYVRCGKNLWPCALLHSFHDFSSFINSGILSGQTMSGTISTYDLSLVPQILIIFLVAAFIMRKKKMGAFVK